MPDAATGITIRPFALADRQAVRDICAAACWMGEYRPDLVPDDWTWAEYWTRYFTDAEPQHAWVACEPGGRVVGYLTGTADVTQFESYALRRMPGIAWHVIRHRLMRRRASRRAVLSFLGALLRDEMRLPDGVEGFYPATSHINLLPEARGGGVGTRLFATFLDCLRREGVRGVHQQPLDINPPVCRLIAKTGFRLVDSWPIRAYAHVYAGSVQLQTWVMKL